jgi:excinuclease ABC subunit C
LLTEGQLIKDYKPRYNTVFRDDKRYLALRADPRAPVPKFTTCRIVRDDSAHYFGPFPSAQVVRTCLDFVERHFGIRKCSPRVPDEETYRHCINDVVRFCSAPCVGRISLEAYRERFEEACAFLRGERPAVLEMLQRQMEEAAQALEFEKAALLRDTRSALWELVRKRARVASTPEMKRERAERGLFELMHALGLSGPPRVIEAFDISNTFGTHAVASMVCAVDGMPQRNRYRRFRIRTVEGIDDPRMMAEVVSRRYRRLREEGRPLPDLVLVDGGITQLRAARCALSELGVEQQASAGLAKQLEAIVLDNGEPPVMLERDSAGLQVLQRLRDEAHRFAITYHRSLRNRRIRESALDEIDGVGERRKQQLLEHFGSVYRLARATPEAIEEVAGIGPELARAIHERLGKRGSVGEGSGGEGSV